MIGGKGPVAFKDNRSGSPRNQPATPGGTDGERTINTVVKKHGVKSSQTSLHEGQGGEN